MNGNGELGTVHLHMDAPKSDAAERLLNEAVAYLNGIGAQTYLTPVDDAVAGPQREALPETYRYHTPGNGEDEDFDAFITSQLGTYAAAQNALRWILPRLQEVPGAVVEAERPFALVKADGSWQSVPSRVEKPYSATSVGFDPLPVHPIEVHHSLDFLSRSEMGRMEQSPPSVEELMERSTEMGMDLGGWFRFETSIPGLWAYRSNRFYSHDLDLDALNSDHSKLREIVDSFGIPCRVQIYVEEVLGVWKSGETALSIAA